MPKGKRTKHDPSLPTREEFAERVLQALAAIGKVGNLNAAEFRIELPDLVVNLRAFFEEYRAAPAAMREKVIARVIASARATEGGPSPDWREASRHILLNVRPRSEIEYFKLEQRESGRDESAMLGQAFVENLWIAVAYDTPELTIRMSREVLQPWGVSFEAAWGTALENLKSISPPAWTEIAPGLFQSEWKDSYDLSRLLLTPLITALHVHGRPVAFLPSRDVLLITGEQNRAGLKMAAERTATIFASQARVVSPIPLVLDEERWEPLPLPKHIEHVLGPTIKQVRAGEYQASKPLIERVLAAEGTDLFVPSILSATRKSTGAPTTLAMWPSNCDTLLPEVDAVVLQIGEDDFVMLPWSVLQESGLIPAAETRWWPPRYRVKDHPSGEQLARLRELAE